MPTQIYHVIGTMSGSSLDGLDIAYCKFVVESAADFHIHSWELLLAETIAYPPIWRKRLSKLVEDDARTFAAIHVQYGHYIGQVLAQYIQKHQLQVDLIASHGHTVFHYPNEQFTCQIGDGAAIAAQTACRVVNDFRAMDVALGGQGAPIASTVDKWLFSDYDFMLNIGGIINITARTPRDYVAFDITAANQILNALAQEIDLEYDAEGQIAAKGKLLPALLKLVNQIPYLEQPYPKTLDNQWCRTNIVLPFVGFDASVADRLHTACQHITYQTTKAIQDIMIQEKLDKNASYRLLATGGGALNVFLMDCIEKQIQTIANIEIVKTDRTLIESKEAILMALMGVMRLEGIPNCLASATGARHNALGGSLHG